MRRLARWCTCLFAVVASGCVAAPPWPATGDGPTPYTASQLRAAHPTGTRLRWRMTASGARGLDQVTEFVGADEFGVGMVQWAERDGEVQGAKAESRATWEELRDHAKFDAEMTTREAATVTVPAGTYPCWLYSVREVARPGVVQRYYFARGHAGPPVLYVLLTDDEEQLRMELLEYRRGGPAPSGPR